MTVNVVILVGNLGQDPEIGETPGGKRFARLSVATSDTWRDKATGERKERTEWHRVVVWGDGLAGMLQKLARKGTKLYVQGKMETRSWEEDGVKKYATEIVVNGPNHSINLLERFGDGTGGGVPAPDREPEGRARYSDYQAPY